MMSALAGSYTESWLVGDISGRSTFCSCATATCCPMTTCVMTCSPPRGGPSCSFTGAAAFASATGMMRTASPGPSTAVKPCVFSAERKTWYPAATGIGRAETIVTCPLTRGSISMLRPVICDIALTTACRSAPWKLSTTSPARGVRATPGAPGVRVARIGAVDSTGGAPGMTVGAPGVTVGAPGASGVCPEAVCAASASATQRIRATIGVFIMSVVRDFAARGESAHIVVQRFAAALALHVHEHALGSAELLVETHHIVHAGERLSVDVLDHVARAQAELLVQTSRLDLAHQEPSVGVGHDQGLVEEFRPAELLLQLAPVDELPVGADRLHHRRQRDGNPRGATLGVLHEHRFARAVADDHDAIAFDRVQAHAGRNLFARTESRLGLSLHDDQGTAAGCARGDSGERHVQVAGRDARFGRGSPSGSAPEKLRAAEAAQIGEIGAPAARHRGRGRLEHAPSPLRQRPAQQHQGSDRHSSGHRRVREHGLYPSGRTNKVLRDRKRRYRHGSGLLDT